MRQTERRQVGIIVALEIEAMFRHYTCIEQLDAPKGYTLYRVRKERCDLYILRTGMGEIAAAAGVQYLIARWNVSVIFNYGVVGGLTADMQRQKLCVVERVVHYKYDCSEFMDLAVGQVDGHPSVFLPVDAELLRGAVGFAPEMARVTCCSGDKFIATPEEKRYLHETFEGNICDMESAGIVLACEMNGVPCLLLKAVSDGLQDGAESFYSELQSASEKCLQLLDRLTDALWQ